MHIDLHMYLESVYTRNDNGVSPYYLHNYVYIVTCLLTIFSSFDHQCCLTLADALNHLLFCMYIVYNTMSLRLTLMLCLFFWSMLYNPKLT